jgi:hypothetical protein
MIEILGKIAHIAIEVGAGYFTYYFWYRAFRKY